MDPFDKILNSIGLIRKTKASVPSVISEGSGNDPFSIWRQSKRIDPEKAFEVYNGWVAACIRAIGEEIGKMHFKLMEIKKDGTSEEIIEHDILDLLEAANTTQTGIELRFLTAAHLESVGNAYWLMVNSKGEPVNDKEIPAAIHILNASRVSPDVSRDVLPAILNGYKYRGQNKSFKIEPHQIIHFKQPDPADEFEGIGTVQTAAQWIDADNYAMEFNRRFFLNGARIGGYLEAQQAYTTEQLEYLKKSFEAVYKGAENAHKTLALPQGVTYKEGGMTQKDLDFATLMDMMRDRILAAFRVPRTALGITDDVNRANAEATDYVFAARTIAPKMELLCAYLNETLVPRFGDNLWLTFHDPIPENREADRLDRQAALGNAPSKSVNEVRAEQGLDPIDGGDDVQIPFSMTPLGAPKAKAASGSRIKRTMRTPRKTRGARVAAHRNEIAAKLAEAAAKAISENSKMVKKILKKKSITQLTDDEFEPIYKAFASRVTPYEKKMRDSIRDFNAQQKEIVLANLPNAVKAAKAVNGSDLYDSEEQVQILVNMLSGIAEDLFSTEGAAAANLIGYELDPLTPETQKALAKALELLSQSYDDETIKLLETKLAEGIGNGASLDELTNLVQDVYAFNDQVRAERVATTETFRIANDATKEAWKQTGVVKTIKWYTAADERVCPWCEPLQGKVIDIEDNFADKGDEITGSDGSKLPIDYADVGAPPIHVSCRCYTRPETIDISE